MQMLLESPLTVVLVGMFLAGIAGFVWTQQGSKWLLGTAIGLVALTAVLTLCSLWIETDRETLTQSLHDVASALQRNDRQYVIARIHPKATEAVQRAKTELQNYNFTEARVTRIKSIAIDDASAVAEFNVVVNLKEIGRKIPRFVKVYFMKNDGRWLVRDYEHQDPTAGFRD
jgi:uncharacterized protein YchJ